MSGTCGQRYGVFKMARESSTLSRNDLVKYRRDATVTWSGFEGFNPVNQDGLRRSDAVIVDGFEMENFA